MAEVTNISWCDHTFNAWVGCTKISPACDHCYAEIWAKRGGHPELWQGDRRRTTAANWRQPLKWNAKAEKDGTRPRVFCSSLADVFDNEVDPDWRADLFELIGCTPHLDWLLLTKRIGNAENMIAQALNDTYESGGCRVYSRPSWPWPNVWIGATIANQGEADRDIPKLLATPARVRFLSCEPLLGPISLRDPPNDIGEPRISYLRTDEMDDQQRIDWVIAGGESGGKARPSHRDWFRSLRDQCSAAGVPFHFKQWGRWAPREALNFEPDPERAGGDAFTTVYNVGNRDAGRTLDGRVHDEFPEI